MSLTADIKTIRYGTPDGHQPLNRGLGASVTVYRGSFAVQTTTGLLKNGATPATTDIILGVVDSAGPGTADTGPGIVNGTTAGAVSVNIATGSFLFATGTGADALTITNNGKPVYAIDESTVGASGGSRVQAGIQLMDPTSDPSIPTGFVAVKVGTPNSPLGGP